MREGIVLEVTPESVTVYMRGGLTTKLFGQGMGDEFEKNDKVWVETYRLARIVFMDPENRRIAKEKVDEAIEGATECLCCKEHPVHMEGVCIGCAFAAAAAPEL